LEFIKREIEIMEILKHPNVVNLLECFEEANHDFYLVLELLTGGNLYQLLESDYTERDVVALLKQVLTAIAFMHGNGIAHRDLKPQNILFTADRKTIKITDFGVSKRSIVLSEGRKSLMTSVVGTCDHVAPEIINPQIYTYTNKVDIWSFGIIAYTLLCGFTPYKGSSQAEVIAEVLHGVINYPSPEWEFVSPAAKDFVRKILKVNPDERPTALELLNHSWMKATN